MIMTSTTAGKGVALLVLLGVVLGGAFYFTVREWFASPAAAPSSKVACMADAKQCPDGSYVQRSGPNCDFVCPTSATNTPVDANASAGIR